MGTDGVVSNAKGNYVEPGLIDGLIKDQRSAAALFGTKFEAIASALRLMASNYPEVEGALIGIPLPLSRLMEGLMHERDYRALESDYKRFPPAFVLIIDDKALASESAAGGKPDRDEAYREVIDEMSGLRFRHLGTISLRVLEDAIGGGTRLPQLAGVENRAYYFKSFGGSKKMDLLFRRYFTH